MAKLTESYLRNMIKKTLRETHDLYPGREIVISQLWSALGDEERTDDELKEVLIEIIKHQDLLPEDLQKIADAVSEIIFHGSVRARSDLAKSQRLNRSRMSESRKK